MKIFLTGGTGYIGQRLLHELLKQGHQVHALARNASNRNLEKQEGLTWFSGDITDIVSIDKAMQGCEAAFHMAAFARVWSRDKTIYYRQNVAATEQILESAVKQNLHKVVFTSSAGVLGPSNGSPVTEYDERIIPFNNEYEETKHLAEEKVRAFSRKGIETVIVNPARVYGPGKMDRSNPVTRYINILRNSHFGIIPGDGNRIGSYCFVDDIVKGHILALEKGISGERYILGGENITYNEMVDIVTDQLKAKRYKIHMPLSIMKGLSAIELMRAKVSSHEPWIIPKWVSKYLYDCALDSSKAKKELGYIITPFHAGAAKTIEWLGKQS